MLRVRITRIAMGVFALTAAAAACPALAEMPAPADPIKLYGNEIRFDVERDGDVVGQHVVTFTRTDEGIRVDARADIDVPLLFVSAYRLKYHSREVWQDGLVQSIEASTNDDGDYITVKAARAPDGLRVQSITPWANDDFESAAILPLSHWNAALLKGGAILNTMSGEVDEVTVRDIGIDTVATRDGSLHARHYIYYGDLNGDIWYDSQGRWVKLRFKADDGSVIEYVCRQCRTAPTITEAD